MEKQSAGKIRSKDNFGLSNSTGSIKLKNVVFDPNAKLLTDAVASLILSDIIEDTSSGKTTNISGNSLIYYFDEEKYFEENPKKFADRVEMLREIPTKEGISEFIYAFFQLLQFSPECCVIFLIYINRLQIMAGVPLLPTTWRPIIFISLLIAQKTWDDCNLSNSTFVEIYPFFDLHQVNVLEMKFLDMIDYSAHINFSLYFKYFLNINSLIDDKDKSPLKPMDMKTSKRLEQQSKEMEEVYKVKSKTGYSKEMGEGTVYVIN